MFFLYIICKLEDVPLVEFKYLVFTCMSVRVTINYRQLRSLLLYLCYIVQVLINSLVC